MAENKTPEFEPPQACVQRVIKAVLPDNVQIGKDAKAAFSRSAGIFIMYLTACANDFCREAKRQTISATDVMQAIKELEFGELEEPLKEFLDQYRREASAKKQIKAAGAGATGPVAKKEGAGDVDEADADGDGDAETDAGNGAGSGAGATPAGSRSANGGGQGTGGGDKERAGGSTTPVAAANDAPASAGGDASQQQRQDVAGATASTTGMDVEPRESSGGAVPMDEDTGNGTERVAGEGH